VAPLLDIAGISTEFCGAICTKFCFTYSPGGITAMPYGLHARLCYDYPVATVSTRYSVKRNLAKGCVADHCRKRTAVQTHCTRLITHGHECTRPPRALGTQTMHSTRGGRRQVIWNYVRTGGQSAHALPLENAPSNGGSGRKYKVIWVDTCVSHGSAVFAGLSSVNNRQTDRQRATSVARILQCW